MYDWKYGGKGLEISVWTVVTHVSFLNYKQLKFTEHWL
jgi:hypothetical protein